MMPQRLPVNPCFTQANKGKSIQGSIYLEDNDSNTVEQSNLKFELVGTSVSKHNESITQNRNSISNSKIKALPDQRKKPRLHISKETNTSNLNQYHDKGQF